jgi:hypothetical protein
MKRPPNETITTGKRDTLSNVRRIGGRVRPLDPTDPRSLDHASHDVQWDELARAIGRAIGRAQYEKDHGGLIE